MKKNYNLQLAQLVNMNSPSAVLEEVKYNFVHCYSIADFTDIRFAFKDFIDLMNGRYPGYKPCNTGFHDTTHTTDALLAISRLIDGYNIENIKTNLPLNLVKIALIATILHDSGYIQTLEDNEGTGAKYTLNHIKRSINFIEKYFQKIGLTKNDFISASNMVKCTGFFVDINHIKFRDKSEQILGSMLGTADLIGQMASRTYLERLIFLYCEFREGGVPGYTSEIDLVKKTLKFYSNVKIRLKTEYQNVAKYALTHFLERYRLDKNLYFVAMEKQIRYLKKILENEPGLYRNKLKRKI